MNYLKINLIYGWLSRYLPWRMRIVLCFIWGALHNPQRAMKYGRGLTVEMQTLMRFNLHIHGKKFLKDFMEESEKLGMRPFLIWGTLLGYMREKDFIDHDSDIDVAILEADYSKKDTLIRAMLKRGYRLRHDTAYQFSFELQDKLLNLDVDVLYSFKGMLVNCIPMNEAGSVLANSFPAQAFRSLKNESFGEAGNIWLPEDPDLVLSACYGAWRVPVKTYSYASDPSSKISNPKALGIGPGNIPFEPFKD